ncbi:ubiquitin-related domain-containing protein [Catenaria anguillulae PL171]|uniref:Ubiquitin-related domain-containing protein n=1 Tax=Catenaria anguillulae PL171 TaxID=765915 RepID=A0A1Y2HTT3_9FUNG|nr:ubiquitin-related domain-containing protein [Catenaria anguillulae PL171]
MTDSTNPQQPAGNPPAEEPAKLDAIDPNDEGTVKEGEGPTANSLRCDDCGKIFRNIDYAQIHAHKSGHANFSESTEIVKPLTEEEKKAKLAELQRKMAERRELRRLQDIQEQKERERIRRKAGQELVEVQEKLKEKEMLLAVEAKKREKIEEKSHKAKILAEIERDRQERLARQKGASAAAPAPKPAAAAPPRPAAAASANTARLQIRGAQPTPLVKEFAADATLQDVMTWLTSQGVGNGNLTTMFPRRVFGAAELTKTLRELDLTPSAALNFIKS